MCGKDAQTGVPKTAALRAAVFEISAKNRRGGCSNTPPPGPARVNTIPPLCCFQNELIVAEPRRRSRIKRYGQEEALLQNVSDIGSSSDSDENKEKEDGKRTGGEDGGEREEDGEIF